jgi:uncharacterized protein YjbI with pentapeptide repeats
MNGLSVLSSPHFKSHPKDVISKMPHLLCPKLKFSVSSIIKVKDLRGLKSTWQDLTKLDRTWTRQDLNSTGLELDRIWLDWTWLDLSGLVWTWLDLTGLDWTWLDLTGLDWTWLDLTGLDWTWLDLTGLDWTWLDLTGLDWTWLDLTGLNWTWLDLTGLDWTWLDLTGPDWTWLDLTGLDWTWLDVTGLDWTWLDLTGLDLTGLDWTDLWVMKILDGSSMLNLTTSLKLYLTRVFSQKISWNDDDDMATAISFEQ